MTTAQYHCPLCTALFQVDTSLAGRQVTCPTCNNVVTLPEATGAAAADESNSAENDQNASLLQLGCPICSGLFRVTGDLQGSQVVCPHCSNTVTVPESADVSSHSAPADDEMAARQSSAGRTPPAAGGRAKPRSGDSDPKKESDRTRPDSSISKHPDPSRLQQRPPERPVEPAPRSSKPSGKAATESAADANSFPPIRKEPSARGIDGSPATRERRDEPRPASGKSDSVDAKRGSQRPMPREMGVNDRLRTSSRGDASSAVGSSGGMTTGAAAVDEPLLPLSVNAEIGIAPGERAALPKVDASTLAPEGTIVIPTENGIATVREPVQKRVMTSSGEVQLRRLSPEEKARRRKKRMLVLWIVGGLLLLATIMVLLYSGPMTSAPR